MERQNTKPVSTFDPLSYRIGALPAVIGLGRSSIYEEVKAGRLRVFKIGNATFAHRDDVRAWLDSYRNPKAA